MHWELLSVEATCSCYAPNSVELVRRNKLVIKACESAESLLHQRRMLANIQQVQWP
jgi:hypothetical protein